MNYSRSFIFIFILWLGVSTTEANAGLSSDSTDSVKHKADITPASAQLDELSFWGGYAFDSYRLWGKTTDATLQSFGLQYNRKLFKWEGAQIEYNLQVSIYSRFSYPEFKTGRPRNSLSGFGVTPLGFQVNFLSNYFTQPFLNSSGGVMVLDDPFPDFRGEKINFTFSLGGGLEFMLSKSVSLSFGMKYHHLSNGELGQVNPGVDSHVYYTAITIF